MSMAFSKPVLMKAIQTRPWIRKVAPNRYRVVPRTADHGKYELTVSWDGNEPSVDGCVDYRFGTECPGFKFNEGNCYHAARLLLHLIQDGRKRQRREAA